MPTASPQKDEKDRGIVPAVFQPLRVNLTIITFLIIYVALVYFNKVKYGELGGAAFGLIIMPVLIPTVLLLTVISVVRVLKNFHLATPSEKNKLLIILFGNIMIITGGFMVIKMWLT